MPEIDGRRELFCREYLKDLNASQAAERAGYSKDRARKTGSELLAVEEVQDRVAELAEGRNKKLELDANLIIIELLRMLTADPLNYVDQAGRVKSLHDMSVDARRAISSFEVEEMPTLGATKTKVKFWSKEKAAELLGRHLTLFKDVLKVEGLEDLAKKIVEARKREDSLV